MEDLTKLSEKAEMIRSSVPKGSRLRWSPEFRSEVIGFIDRGVSSKLISKSTGIAHQTIKKWLDAGQPAKSSFKEVEIVPGVQEISINWPGGPEVHGLTFNQLTLLLREGLI